MSYNNAFAPSFCVSYPDLLSLFVEPLNDLGITYMATGAVAAILYGEPRLTNDIDLVVSLSPVDVDRLHKTFSTSDFYVPPIEVMLEEIARPQHGHFNLIHIPTALKADIYLVGTDSLNHRASERRREVALSGGTLWVAPIEYVIVRKLEYLKTGGQDMHRQDVMAILRTSGGAVDRGVVLAEVQLALAMRNISGEQVGPYLYDRVLRHVGMPIGIRENGFRDMPYFDNRELNFSSEPAWGVGGGEGCDAYSADKSASPIGFNSVVVRQGDQNRQQPEEPPFANTLIQKSVAAVA